MGSARLQAVRAAGGNEQEAPASSAGTGGFDNAQGDNVMDRYRKMVLAERDAQAKAQADAAALSSAEQAASQKTAELANSAGGGITINTNGQGSTSYTEGNPGQDDNQSQGDVDLSTSDTTLRRRGGYRRDAGIRI